MGKNKFEVGFVFGAKKAATFDKTLTGMEKAIGGLGKKIGGLAKAAAGIAIGFVGISAIKTFASESVAAAKAQIDAETKLEAVLQNVKSIQAQGPAAYKQTATELKGIASELQGVGVIGDEVTLAGMQQLATFQLSGNEIGVLSKGMTDLLAQQKGLNATQQDAVNIGNMIGKVMGGQVGALSRVGITFDKAQEKILKMGTAEEKAAVLAEILEQNVGGVNAALAETDQGKIQQAANAWGDMKEEIGKGILPAMAKLAPLVGKALPIVQSIGIAVVDKISMGLDWVLSKGEKLAPIIQRVETVVGDVSDAVKGLVNDFKTLGFSGTVEKIFGGSAGAVAKKAEEYGAVVMGSFQKAMSGDFKGAAIDIGGILGFKPETVEKAFEAISGAANIVGAKLQWAFETAKPAIDWVVSVGLPGTISLVQGMAELVVEFGGFVVDNWSTIEPIILGIGAAFLLWKLPDVIGAGTEMLLNFGSAVTGLPGGIGKATKAQLSHIKSLVLDKLETVKLAGMYAKDFALSLLGNVKAVGASTKAWIINKGQLVGQKLATFALKGAQLISTGVTAGMTAAQWALNAAFVASPIGWVVLGIGALIAIGILLWKNWDTVKAKALELWDGMKSAFGNAVSWFQGIWSGVTGAFDNFMSGLSAKCPLLADIIMVPVNSIKGYIDGLKQSFSGVVAFVSGVFTGDWEKAWNGVKDIFGGVFNSFASLAKTPINAVIAVINGAIRGINGINVEVPDWVPGMGGKTFGFTIPEIPALAKGGVVTSPTLAMIGEGRESEAVLPLSKLRGMLQANSSFAAAQVGNIGGNALGFMGVLQRLLEALSGGKNGGGSSLTFSPNVVVTVEGNGNETEIQEAVRRAIAECEEELRRMWEEMQWEKNRTAFAH